jgi:transposase InsO family protein
MVAAAFANLPWAWMHGIKLDFSRLGKPTDNATIESFDAPASDGSV